jgi:aromatic ring-opening dioxygenase catalytic subunit (LigB family)
MSSPTSRQPTFFIPHGGGPCFFMEVQPADTWDKMRVFLEGLLDQVPERPKAILLVSAHWEEPQFTVHDGARPGLLFDYYGFPAHTYELEFPAPGAPKLAARVRELLAESGINSAAESERGWDHGVFVPLLLVTPAADIPVLQLSLQHGLDPQAHLAVGRALEPLRDEGVLIVASGMSYHNLRAFGPAGAEISAQFDDWLTEAVEIPEIDQRALALSLWDHAPAARLAHPREEHLIPLMVAAGAGGNDRGERIYADRVKGLALSAYRFG